jgi:hypothetical protein
MNSNQLPNNINASIFLIRLAERTDYFYVREFILEANNSGNLNIGIVRFSFSNFTIQSFKITFNKTYSVVAGNNSLLLSPRAILAPKDLLFFESSSTQITAYQSTKSDWIWSNRSFEAIHPTTDYQFNIKIVVEDFIFKNPFHYNYSYHFPGTYSIQVYSEKIILNDTQSVDVLPGIIYFLVLLKTKNIVIIF